MKIMPQVLVALVLCVVSCAILTSGYKQKRAMLLDGIEGQVKGVYSLAYSGNQLGSINRTNELGNCVRESRELGTTIHMITCAHILAFLLAVWIIYKEGIDKGVVNKA